LASNAIGNVSCTLKYVDNKDWDKFSKISFVVVAEQQGKFIKRSTLSQTFLETVGALEAPGRST